MEQWPDRGLTRQSTDRQSHCTSLTTDDLGLFPPEGHPPGPPRRHFSPYIPHSRNSNRRICVAPAGFGEAAPVHLTSGPSSLFPFGDFVDLLMYFKEVSCSHQRKFLARRSFGHWEPHRFTGSSRPSCNPGFTEVLSWVQVEGWRERRPAFVKDILGNYIHDLDVFEFSLAPFRPCQKIVPYMPHLDRPYPNEGQQLRRRVRLRGGLFDLPSFH